MKKMYFRLEHVLKIREFAEKTAKLELGNVLGKISATKMEIEEIKKSCIQVHQEFNQFLLQTRRVQEINIFPYLIESLERIVLRKEENLAVLNVELEVKKNNLKIAEKRFKIIEKLKEKKLHQFIKEEKIRLQNELDDNIIMRKEEK